MKSYWIPSCLNLRTLRLGGLFALLTAAPLLASAEVALQFGGADLVTADTALAPLRERGAINPNSLLPLSSDLSYKGPVFTGGFGRSNNGSVDRAEIVNDTGPARLDMLGFTEGGMGLVDRIYGLIRFPATSFTGRFADKPIRIARTDAFSIRTYTGFVPDQQGWLYFYVESNGEGFLSPPFSYTREVDAGWGEKTITLADPRAVTWTRFLTVDTTPDLQANRPQGTPDFEQVTAVGFYFMTNVTNSDKNTARFFTDFFLVHAAGE